MDQGKLKELKAFIAILEAQPQLLSLPELQFFRVFMEKHGASFPDVPHQPTPSGGGGASEEKKAPAAAPAPPHKEEKSADPEISDDEEHSADEDEDEKNDSTGAAAFMLPEEEDLPPLGNHEEAATDEQMDKIAALKQEAADALEDGKPDVALSCMTNAMGIGATTALSYAKRADLLLKLKRPVACIRDCDEAIRMNPDSGKAYRIRGKAHAAMGDWENAHKDLELGQRIDYDEDLYETQKLVAEKWRVIDAKLRSKQRRRAEREMRNKLRERRRRQAAARRAYEAQKADEEDFEDMGDDNMPPFNPEMFGGAGAGGMFGGAGAGGAGGAGGMGGLGGLLGGLMGNPAMKKAMENPKVLQAVMEMMKDPSAFAKYQNDPEVMEAFNGLMSSMGGSGGGGVPGAAHAAAGHHGPGCC